MVLRKFRANESPAAFLQWELPIVSFKKAARRTESLHQHRGKEAMKQLSLWDYVPPESEVTPIPIGFDGTPIYYSETGFVLKEPRTLVCEHCCKTWTTIRPEVTKWNCQPATCFFGNPASFSSTLPEQIEDEDDGEPEED